MLQPAKPCKRCRLAVSTGDDPTPVHRFDLHSACNLP